MLHNFAFKKRLHHLCAATIAIFSYLLSGDECKAVIKTLESKSPAITPSNGQHQTAGMFCQMSRKLHKITDHRTYSSAMYFLPAGSILLFQRFLPYDSKDIICDHCQLQHQFVALKLSRRESFNIHVRLDFTVPHWGLTLLKKAFIKETAGKISIDEDAVNDLRIGSIPFLFPVFFCRFVCDKNAEIVQNQAGIDFLCILSGFDLNNTKLQEIKMTVGILCVDCRKCEVMQIDQMAS